MWDDMGGLGLNPVPKAEELCLEQSLDGKSPWYLPDISPAAVDMQPPMSHFQG